MNDIAGRLFPKWQALLASITDNPGEGEFQEIVSAYSVASRHYHNLEHIGHVLETLEAIQSSGADRTALELAAWFHDLVYDSRANDNEERSTDRAEEVFLRWKLAAPLRQKVNTIILATKKHRAAADDLDTQTFLDADLAILSEEAARYQAYARAIRQEYAWVAEGDFRAGRSKVLRAFLGREEIYFTPVMKGRELVARRNMEWELEGLKGDF